jgi:hypothetical protein
MRPEKRKIPARRLTGPTAAEIGFGPICSG